MSTLFDPATLDTIKNRISSLSPTSQAQWGNMNVDQMMCHVTDGFLMSMGDRPLPDQSSFLDRTLIKFLVLNVIKMPKEVPTAAGLDQMREGTKPGEFNDNLRNLRDSLNRLSTLGEDHAWAAHPKFGPMKRSEWGILGYKHIDHHLKQFGV